MHTQQKFVKIVRPRSMAIFSVIVVLLGVGALISWRKLSAFAFASSNAMQKSSGSESGAQTNPSLDLSAKAKLKQAYGRLPMNFEVNQGQADESVKFLSRGHGYQVFLTDAEAALVLQSAQLDETKNSGETLQQSSMPWRGKSQTNILRFKPV